MDDVEDLHRQRYGGPLVSPRTAKILVAVAGAVFVAIVIVVGLFVAREEVRYDVLAYDHLASDRIGVDFVVTMAPGTEATCRIQAMNEGRAQVGFVETTIPAQAERRTAHRVEISTQGEAVSAEVVGCTVG
ncbi:hypothetical protein Y09_2455 [Brachybacterium sp. SW0106-09]|uniref:DUF4307 domain-containing protein n=1 Tax=Brachybacterium sp. SW0106-09 TaxID=1704590 RepID=UPI0006B66C54|nr:DUF4307 domain-containing protein [Brachybacterium sp. SW0106-09]GAP79607.1 hypothetical protein Y09_2455 [Brachybacterium sp. SW0106-09]